MIVLGIESSCDETSVAILNDGKVVVNLIASQDFHKNYGGVIPELSSRAHLQTILPLVRQAVKEAEIELGDIDLICATAGPGLIGAVLVGFTFSKALAFSLGVPFVPVNHIEGHIYSGFLMEEKPEFPVLTVVLSGGHTFLLIVEDDLTIKKLGTTIDDAAGEAFDKVAKLLGLGYPGGPKIQQLAENGDFNKILFPIAKTKKELDFSFSGLKTSVLRYVENTYPDKIVPEADLPDLAASFENAIIRAVNKKAEKALKENKINSVSLVGGVAANLHLRNALGKLAQKYKKKYVVPDLQFCGDNAAMIAYRGWRLHLAGKKYSFDYNAFPSLPEDIFIN